MTDEPEDIKTESELPDVVVEDSNESEPEASLEDGIKELKLKLQQEQTARANAEQMARDMQGQAKRANSEVQDTNLQLIHSAMDGTKRNGDALKGLYAQALQAGAFDRAAEIQEQMSLNSAKLLQLENGRAALQARLDSPEPQHQNTVDPVEQVASQLSPRSAMWVRNHPQCITDKRLYQKMVGAHNIAMADGYTPDSDAYFDFIETQIGFKRAPARNVDVDVDDPMSAASAPAVKRNAPPAAPSSRAAGSSNSRSGTVQLSREEREVASMMGMSAEDYARNKIALKREGKLN